MVVIGSNYGCKDMLSKVCYLGSNGPNDGLNHFLKFLLLGFRLEKLLKSGSRDLKQALSERTSIAYIHQSNFKRNITCMECEIAKS